MLMESVACASSVHDGPHRGHSPISDEEVVKLYRGTHIPLQQMNSFYGHPQEVSIRCVH